MRTQTIIRDSKTGQFSSRETFNRSISHGGTRYKEEEIKYKEKPEWEEWAITFEYP